MCVHASMYPPPPPSPDSIDTPRVLKHLRDLVGACNIYCSEQPAAAHPNLPLLEAIALYCTKMLKVFGVVPSDCSIGYPVVGGGAALSNMEDAVMPFATLLADFREEVRTVSLEQACECIT